MTQTIESLRPVSLSILRDALTKAERQIARLDSSNIEAFLLLLDRIEEIFIVFGEEQAAMRSEEGRWIGLQARITTESQAIVAAAARVGGLAKLRTQYSPASGFWWHLDTVVTGQRSQRLKRISMVTGTVVIAMALVWWGVSLFASANADGGAMSSVTSTVEQLVHDQQWQEALNAVEIARQTWPDAPELLVWEAVLAEQLDDVRVETVLSQAQKQLAGEPATFWKLIGNARLQASNVSGAEEAAQQALALAPQDAQVTLLLGSIAEARGELAQATEYFNQTIRLAEESNPELVVIVKMRMGNMLPSVGPMLGAPFTSTITRTLAPD